MAAPHEGGGLGSPPCRSWLRTAPGVGSFNSASPTPVPLSPWSSQQPDATVVQRSSKSSSPIGRANRRLKPWQCGMGTGRCRLLDHDPVRKARLIEHCQPGTHLSDSGAARALEILVELLPRLWKPAGEPFRSLADEAAPWREELPSVWQQAGQPFERRLIDAAVEVLAELASSQGKEVLLHQDLHADNVLAAQREPWLVIDPKPLRGEREFGIASIVRAYELGHEKKVVIGRLDLMTSELSIDRERARLWSFAQTLAWSFEGTQVLTRHVETARWLLLA